ncbi:hypothetical protein AT245_04425 [Bartonella henselae]|nr:hypothetical protein AT244_00240 [Bartonella henselae]OLL47160.1 hypothetical protein AT245_04425 [Bartonella henselae]
MPAQNVADSPCIEMVHKRHFSPFLKVFYLCANPACDVQVNGFDYFNIRGVKMKESYGIKVSHSRFKKCYKSIS